MVVMTTADQLALVNKLLQQPEEAHTLAQVSLFRLTIDERLSYLPPLSDRLVVAKFPRGMLFLT